MRGPSLYQCFQHQLAHQMLVSGPDDGSKSEKCHSSLLRLVEAAHEEDLGGVTRAGHV